MRYVNHFVAATAVMALTAGAAQAQDKQTLAIVVKGLDNPFFEQINLGCQDWAANNPDSEYECLYTGPASSADEAGYRRAGMRPWIPETVSLALIAGTVVAIMPVVGAILGVALIVAPAAAARLVVRDWRWMLVLAPAIGITAGVIGLLASRWLDLAAGGAIALAAALLYGAAWLVGSARDRARPAEVRATIEARTP